MAMKERVFLVPGGLRGSEVLGLMEGWSGRAEKVLQPGVVSGM